MVSDLSRLLIDPARPVLEAVAQMDRNRLGIVLVVDGEGKLVGTVTDGDVRRGILAKLDLRQPIEVLLARKAEPAMRARSRRRWARIAVTT
jgi:CBS domain-containing protein